jgi:hypothetical protein
MWLAVFVLVLVAGGRVVAEVRMPDGKDLPKAYLKDPSNAPLYVYVVADKLKARDLPRADAPEAISDPFHFMDLFVTAYKYTSGGKIYHLLVKLDSKGERIDEYLGWVEDRFLLFGSEAIRHPVTNIARKTMIINSTEMIKLKVRAANYYLAPEETREQSRGEYRLFQVYFVYKEVEGSNRGGGTTPSFVLLDSAPGFSRDRKDVILGRVPRESVCQWDTCEGFEWDVPSTLPSASPRQQKWPGIIYATRDAAEKAIEADPDNKAALEQALKGAHFVERFGRDGTTVPLRPDQMRFPILERVTEVRGNYLLKVGVFGDFVGADGVVARDQAAIDRLQKQLADLRSQVSTTEIVFVIHDTVNMKDWFDKVAGVVDDIVRDVDARSATSRRTDRVAFTYYSDKKVTPHVLVDTSDAAVRRMVEELKEHEVEEGACCSGSSRASAKEYGRLASATTAARWSSCWATPAMSRMGTRTTRPSWSRT